jgi:hypothetical protein
MTTTYAPAGGFKTWLRSQADRDDPVGDLARDALQDRDWPRGAARLATLDEHLYELGAIRDAHVALWRAWAEWRGMHPRDARDLAEGCLYPDQVEARVRRRERRPNRRTA